MMARGGVRKGAGRKAQDGATLAVTLNIRVDNLSLELIDEFGGGGPGVRAICRELTRLRSAKNSGTARAILKRPVRAAVPTHSPEGHKYNLTKLIELNAKADAAHARALALWHQNSGT